MLGYYWQGFLLGATAAAQPGPFQAYLLSQTLQNGWKPTLLAALAPLISDGPIIVLMLFILNQTPSWLLAGLQLIGGFFLLYLASKAFTVFRQPPVEQPIDLSPQKLNLFEAALINGLSPGPYIFWATVTGPILVTAWHKSAGHATFFMIGFYGTLIAGFVGFITFFALAKRINSNMNRLLSGLSAVALLGFGLYQIWQGTAVWLG